MCIGIIKATNPKACSKSQGAQRSLCTGQRIRSSLNTAREIGASASSLCLFVLTAHVAHILAWSKLRALFVLQRGGLRLPESQGFKRSTAAHSFCMCWFIPLPCMAVSLLDRTKNILELQSGTALECVFGCCVFNSNLSYADARSCRKSAMTM